MFIIKERHIINQKTGRQIHLKGVNLGGWLMMEGYILGGRNITETEFKKRFKEINGDKELSNFVQSFRANFITENDIRYIKNLGFNCVRIPFHWKVVENDFEWIVKVVNWCKKHQVYCILDMHSVPGSQNGDWHSDPPVPGKSLFWNNESFYRKYFSLWDKISKFFKDEEIIAGYDVMNEPVIYDRNWYKTLAYVYNKVIKVIRKNNDNHIVFLEGNMWASVYDFLKYIEYKENIAVSIHFYHPIDYTFNLVHNIRYPNKKFNKEWLHKILFKYKKLFEKYNMPVYVGEFGVNFRCENSCYGEQKYIEDVISSFNKFKFHWTIWTYKTVYIHVQPSGLFVYYKNPPFVARQENDFGWERYITHWYNYKDEIKKSWKSDNFSAGLVKIIKKI